MYCSSYEAQICSQLRTFSSYDSQTIIGSVNLFTFRSYWSYGSQTIIGSVHLFTFRSYWSSYGSQTIVCSVHLFTFRSYWSSYDSQTIIGTVHCSCSLASSDSQTHRSVCIGRSLSLCSKGGFSSFAAGALFIIADAALYATADVLYLKYGTYYSYSEAQILFTLANFSRRAIHQRPRALFMRS